MRKNDKNAVLFFVFLALIVLAIVVFGKDFQQSLVGQAYTSSVKTIYVKQASLSDHECNDSEWHFVINQIPDECEHPASIHVYWSNGEDAIVPLEKSSGDVAHYTSNLYLSPSIKVTNATADICDDWDGQFVLSHGPCKPTAVTLASFSGECGVTLRWETAQEMNNQGFNIYRSGTGEDGSWVKMNNNMIPAKNFGQMIPASYEWYDTDVEQGKIYYYRLEDIEYGSYSTMHAPVKIKVDCELLFDCTDSDSGLVFDEKGTCVDSSTHRNSIADSCQGNSLYEMYCHPSMNKCFSASAYTCPEGYTCNNGACVPE